MDTKTMDSIFIKQGIYDPLRRFEFTNVTTEPFSFKWNLQEVVVEAGKRVELPHYLAVLATNKLVDQLMTAEFKKEEDEVKVKTNNPYYRTNRGGSLAVPAARLPFIAKILKEMPRKTGAEATLGIIQLKDQLVNDTSKEISAGITSSADVGIPTKQEEAMKEFEGVNLPSKGL